MCSLASKVVMVLAGKVTMRVFPVIVVLPVILPPSFLTSSSVLSITLSGVSFLKRMIFLTSAIFDKLKPEEKALNKIIMSLNISKFINDKLLKTRLIRL
ncbi:hypothetical protein C1645_788764 [Glomus cerebriforme]|uniref:Uncharacterized protein n=1 Tax=Glomus cerebriforme TaxID=658196 RepID=A0A397S770_9GLOM|nr:hypothetical protein C1645_788764 [Glomus cerebriforme]